MSRPLGKLLDSAAGRLFALADERPDVAPTVALVASLVALVAADADDHIARRLADAEAIRALLARARDSVPASEREAIDAALAWQPTQPADFRRERIENHLTDLRRALIGVHVWLETPDGGVQHALLDDVWAFLKADAARRSRLVTSLW